jgi:hypothetical protein
VLAIITAPYSPTLCQKMWMWGETSTNSILQCPKDTSVHSKLDIFLVYIWSQRFQIRYFNVWKSSGIFSQIKGMKTPSLVTW